MFFIRPINIKAKFFCNYYQAEDKAGLCLKYFGLRTNNASDEVFIATLFKYRKPSRQCVHF